MNHILKVEAKAVATDEGQFTALAAAYTLDRAGDRIIPGAFGKTIDRWRASSKLIPLHWNHESDPASIIGSVDPNSLQETSEGLEVSGQLDLENSTKAKEAWRAMKTGSMSLSFGYMVVRETKAKDGVNDLEELDLFEISVVPVPANADTRFLSLKSVREMDPSELRDEVKALNRRLDEITSALDQHVQPPAKGQDVPDEEPKRPTPKASDPEADRVIRERIEALT